MRGNIKVREKKNGKNKGRQIINVKKKKRCFESKKKKKLFLSNYFNAFKK